MTDKNNHEIGQPVEMKLVRTNCLTRWPCDVCGGHTEKVPVVCENEKHFFRICEFCLEAGNIDERLAATAAQLEEDAQWTRSFIGCLVVPTYEEWSREVDAFEKEWALAGDADVLR